MRCIFDRSLTSEGVLRAWNLVKTKRTIGEDVYQVRLSRRGVSIVLMVGAPFLLLGQRSWKEDVEVKV